MFCSNTMSQGAQMGGGGGGGSMSMTNKMSTGMTENEFEMRLKNSVGSMIPFNGQHVKLASDIPEEERAYFLVLNFIFSQHNRPADLGYLYDVEFDDTFSMRVFINASAHFKYFQFSQPVKAGQTAVVKFINLGSVAQTSSDTNSKLVNVAIIREFNLMKKYPDRLVQIYFALARTMNVYYLYMEKADESLEEFIQRRNSGGASNSLKNQFNKSQASSGGGKRIAINETRNIIGTVADTLLLLHRQNVIHGSLTPMTIFLFKNKNNPNEMQVKLGNFIFSNDFSECQADQEQFLVEEVLKNRELHALYEIAHRMGEVTDFRSFNERDAYYEIIKIIQNTSVDMPEVGGPEEDVNSLISAQSTRVASAGPGTKMISDRRLQFFIDSFRHTIK